MKKIILALLLVSSTNPGMAMDELITRTKNKYIESATSTIKIYATSFVLVLCAGIWDSLKKSPYGIERCFALLFRGTVVGQGCYR